MADVYTYICPALKDHPFKDAEYCLFDHLRHPSRNWNAVSSVVTRRSGAGMPS